MGNLLQYFKRALEKWNAFSLIKKISISVIVLVAIVLIVSLSVYAGSTKYGVLFSNMDSTDSTTVLAQLKTSKTPYKVQGNSILVPVNQVDTLRLQLASSITNGSKGFELFDSASQFGMTDQQMTIDYQRALEGELERTIKGFPQVDGARVHLVMEQDSAFVTDSTPATASVTLKLKPGYDLSTDQVKAMIALITGAVKNLPKQNVQIIDDKMRLLSAGIYDSGSDQSASSAASTEKQQAIKSAYENNLEAKALAVVQPIAGSGHVKITVNADLNFDSISQDTITYDPKSVPVSQKNTKSTTTSNSGTQSGQSALDANTNSSVVSYPSTTQNSGTNGSTSEDNTINYDVGQTEVKSVVAPGSVKRLTASVVFDGTLSDQDKAQIKDLVSNAIGYNNARNDSITITGMHFDTSAQDSVKSDIAQMNTLSKQQSKTKLYSEIGIGAGALIVLSILFFSLRKRTNEEDANVSVVNAPKNGLNVKIGDEISPKDINSEITYQAIDFEPNDEKVHLEKQIRKYATDKPEQVVDVIKSWISDDER